ncbi:hypothetical protein V6N11_068533 [Hibiscus sabdariffa]|uniref:Uncharacterized protein n=1 Tax=Hibiscus sabdariffa TaxID=183260 RepID=A0ABR2P9Z2_9ROSI
MEKLKKKLGSISFWNWVVASIIFRLILIYFPKNLNLSSRPEVSTPLTSFRRLAEGYWLKQLSMSPYAGLIPLAAFGWVIATHLSLYPAILIIPHYCIDPSRQDGRLVPPCLCFQHCRIVSTSCLPSPHRIRRK